MYWGIQKLGEVMFMKLGMPNSNGISTATFVLTWSIIGSGSTNWEPKMSQVLAVSMGTSRTHSGAFTFLETFSGLQLGISLKTASAKSEKIMGSSLDLAHTWLYAETFPGGSSGGRRSGQRI